MTETDPALAAHLRKFWPSLRAFRLVPGSEQHRIVTRSGFELWFGTRPTMFEWHSEWVIPRPEFSFMLISQMLDHLVNTATLRGPWHGTVPAPEARVLTHVPI